MNHDDVLLPDHLTVALDILAAEQTDFFAGRAAVAWGTQDHPTLGCVPDFQWLTPGGRVSSDVFRRSHLMFEPCSAWVVERSLAQRVGAWRSSLAGHRASIQEWLMRAWRAGAGFSFDAPVTALRFNKQFASSSEAYADSQPPPQWLEACASRSPSSTRQQIQQVLSGRQRVRRLALPRPLPESRLRRQAMRLFVNRFTAGLYRRSGWDAFEFAHDLMGSRKGDLGKNLSVRRTGFDLATAPSIESAVRQALTATGEQA
jgi:hypothetical protein